MRNLKLILTLALLLLFCGFASAQQSQTTVTQPIYRNLNNIPAQGVIIQNIGQGAHMISAVEHDAPAHSCSTGVGAPGQLLVSLEFSMDGGATWNLLSQIVGDPSNETTNYIRYATGIFPGLRLTVYGFDTTNCLLDLNYMGSLYPIGAIPAEFNGFLVATCSGFGACSGGTTAITTIMQSAIPHNPHLGPHLSVYGVYMQNLSASPEQITLRFTTVANNCATMTNSPQTIPVTLPAGNTQPGVFIMPSASVPYVIAGPSPSLSIPGPENICITTGANPSTHNFFAQVIYRIEP